MRNRRVLPVWAAGLAAVAGLLAAPSPAEAVIGGGPAAASDPVALVSVTLDATSSVRCSGVLVAPRTVVTARHCIHGRAPSAWRIVLGAGRPGADEHRVSEVLVPGDAVVDLAAVRLDSPAHAAPVPLTGSDTASGPAVAFGYGSTGNGEGPVSPTAKEAGVALAGADELAGTGHRLLRTVPADTGAVPAGACAPGDSGGPLRDGADGQGPLIGITSRNDGPSGQGRCWSVPTGPGTPGGEWLAALVARW